MAGANDQLAAAASCNSDAENKKPGAVQNCSDIINIAVFFDGTGNNKKVDEPIFRLSNPARIWQTAQELTGLNTTNFSFYISGVGTEFSKNDKTPGLSYDKDPIHWTERNERFIEDNVQGGAFGGGGTRRTEFGERNVNDALRQALLDNASKHDAVTKAYAKTAANAKLAEINNALMPYKLITVINLSVFGFSRGAALARAFVNDFIKKHCKLQKDGKTLHFNGHPVVIKFLGLFDTVASFGLPGLNIDAPFFERNLVVPSAVEKCVHLVAAHEIRFSFPVDLIRKDGKYRSNYIELVYPGVHSDVGGGYEPMVQGISHNYSRIPMRKMMRVAVKSGVRILDYDKMEEDRATMFAELYAVLPETEKRFVKYMAAVNPPDAVEGAVEAHMKALYSGWGTMTRKKMKTPDLIATKDSTAYNFIGHIGIAEEAGLLLRPFLESMKKIGNKALYDSGARLHQAGGLAYKQVVRPEPWRLIAWKTDCSPAVMDFIQHTVHDSKAGFMNSVEPFSYFRPRGMAESSRNVLARGLDWLDDAATKVKKVTYRVLYSVGKATVDTGVVVVETLHDGVLYATKKYKVAQKFVLEKTIAGAVYTIEVVQAGHQVMISTMEATGRFIVTSAQAAKKKTGEFIDETKKSAGEAADTAKKNVGEFADAAQKKGGEFVDTVSRKSGEFVDSAGKTATELGQNIQNGASRLGSNVGQAYDAGLKAVESNWAGAKAAFGY